MTVEELIKYADVSLSESGLKLSQTAKVEIAKRFNKSEDQGGYSNYWKNTTVADVKRKLKVLPYSGEGKIIIWVNFILSLLYYNYIN